MRTGYKVCDAMTQRPIAVSPYASIASCAALMARRHIGSLVIKRGDRLVGLLTEKDIVRKVVAKKLSPRKTRAVDIMQTSFPTIAPEKDIYSALALMRDRNVRQLPVMAGSRMVGFLTTKDILKIQPQLFEILSEKIELREWQRKAKSLDLLR